VKKTMITRSVRLDAETDEHLRRLSKQFDFNLSMAIRRAIRVVATAAAPSDLSSPDDRVENETRRE